MPSRHISPLPDLTLLERLVEVTAGPEAVLMLSTRQGVIWAAENAAQALLSPPRTDSLPLAERCAIAAFTAFLSRDVATQSYYRGLLRSALPGELARTACLEAEALRVRSLCTGQRDLPPDAQIRPAARVLLGDRITTALNFATALTFFSDTAGLDVGAGTGTADMSSRDLHVLARIVALVLFQSTIVAGLGEALAALRHDRKAA